MGAYQKCARCGASERDRANNCIPCRIARETRSLAQSFASKTNRDGPIVVPRLGPCWNWTGNVHRKTHYGYMTIGSRRDGTRRCELAHRIAFFVEHDRWPVPHAMHLCDNRLCVKAVVDDWPAHIQEGTAADNNVDMASKGRNWQQRKTHCPQGHPYDETNTRLYRGRRYCRACLGMRPAI